jgi:hypothetical protein
MPLSREPFFLRMAIWLRGLERWYLVLGGVAVGRGFKPQSDLELFFAEILIIRYHTREHQHSVLNAFSK